MRELINPATGLACAELPDTPVTAVNAAVRRARDAFAEWGRTTPAERARLLLRVADLAEADADELTRLEVEETGKPAAVFRDGELPFAIDNLRFFAGAARSLDGTGAGVFSAGYTSVMLRRPVGVIGSIAPWNFPFVMAVWKIGPAVAAGNAVVIKPAPQTPRSTLRLAELFAKAGAPDGLVQVITGDAAVGEALVTDPGVDMVSVTGSTETGRAVMTGAARTLKRVHLELGGKAPALVFEDADLAQAARGVALGATYNTGQDCTAATRVYVAREVYGETVEALRATLEGIRVGDPWDPATDIGPLISSAHRDRVHGFVSRSRRADSARRRAGRRARILLSTHFGNRCRTGQRDRPGRAVRARARRAAVRRRGRGGRLGQRHPLRPGLFGVVGRRRPRDAGVAPPRCGGDVGQ